MVEDWGTHQSTPPHLIRQRMHYLQLRVQYYRPGQCVRVLGIYPTTTATS